jgi:hypothetical protein
MTSAAADMYSQSLLLPMITPTIGALLSAIVVPRAFPYMRIISRSDKGRSIIGI